jgi:methylamine utilization protein MauE
MRKRDQATPLERGQMRDRTHPPLAIRRAERVQLLGQCRSRCERLRIHNGRPLLPPQVSAIESSRVIGINQVMGSVISGCAVSCGAVIALAGTSKLYRGTRGLDDMTAIRRALRMPRRQWRLFGLTAGGMECVVGAVVCSGAHPVLSGASLTALGAVFCALLAYVVVKRVPGGCGCIRWRTTTETAAEAPTWRAMARGGMLLGTGIAYTVVSVGAANAPRQYWFGGGVVAGIAVLVLLSMPGPVRTPVCRRPLWRTTRTTLRALASHETFAAMAGSAGPFGPVARYRRTGCTDEFWFTVPADQGGQAVVFRVSRAAPGARLVIHASRRDVRTSGSSWPARTFAVTASKPRINRGRRYEVSGSP